MMRISSASTWLYKRVFPVVWLGGLGVFTLISVIGMGLSQPFFIALPILMAAAGVFFMRKMVWVLMDEVLDGDDYLVVRKLGDEERIPLSEIVNVNFTFGRPSLITLRLRTPGRFGNEILFLPVSRYSFNPFAKNFIAEDLIARVDRARSAHVSGPGRRAS